jgi:hypothetical protein
MKIRSTRSYVEVSSPGPVAAGAFAELTFRCIYRL